MNLEIVTEHPRVSASGKWLAIDWDNGISGPHVSHSPTSQPGLIHREISRVPEEETHARPQGLGSELAHHHFCHNLLAKASYKASPDLRN